MTTRRACSWNEPEQPRPGARLERADVFQTGSAWAYQVRAGWADEPGAQGVLVAQGVTLTAAAAWAAVRRELKADRLRSSTR